MMTERQHFNLALIPEEDTLQRLCVELARANCAIHADSYLLGENALPHVTVCQFEADPEEVNSIWSTLTDLLSRSVNLGFRHIYVQFGKDELVGKCWVGLAVRLDAAVLDLQKIVYQRLLDQKIESPNKPENYFPHLTFARCDATQPIMISQAPPDVLWTSRYLFRLTIGHSDEHGRYHHTIVPT